MPEITAAAVMALREKTGLPMMECKKALAECGGNTDEAVEWLRKQGIKTQSMRADRETSCGRLAVYTDPAKGVGAIIELKCESPPVAGSPDFKALCEDLAKTLALGPGAASPEELMAQKSQAHPDKTLGELKDDLFNRMREVFELSRIKSLLAPRDLGGAHSSGKRLWRTVTTSGLMHLEARRPRGAGVAAQEEVLRWAPRPGSQPHERRQVRVVEIADTGASDSCRGETGLWRLEGSGPGRRHLPRSGGRRRLARQAATETPARPHAGGRRHDRSRTHQRADRLWICGGAIQGDRGRRGHRARG